MGIMNRILGKKEGLRLPEVRDLNVVRSVDSIVGWEEEQVD